MTPEKTDPVLRSESCCPEVKTGPVFPAADDPITYSRPDWTEFRDLARISAKAGVRTQLLPRVAVKEVADNAFDAGGEVTYGILERSAEVVRVFVHDGGPVGRLPSRPQPEPPS